MLELLRFFRLGVVNVVGVTVPGILFLLFAGVGSILPLAFITLYFNQVLTGVRQDDVWLLAGSAYRENKAALTVLLVLVAYVIGYIIRLSSPDELDRKSAKKSMRLIADESPGLAARLALLKPDLDRKIKEGMLTGRYWRDVKNYVAASEESRFPYRGERVNKFPYNNFKDYLINRGFEEYARCVPPHAGAPPADPRGKGRWTKTAVNMMKLEVQLLSPVLAAVIESNEAHIRLLSGTWQAINACRRVVVVGVGLALLGSAANVLDKTGHLPSAFAGSHPPSFLPCLLAGAVLYAGMRWARRRIETMFHHQRVRELTHIVGCFYFAREKYAAAAQSDVRGKDEGRARETRWAAQNVPAL